MSRTLIGISSFSGLQFLEITLREIQQTVKSDGVALFVVVAKPHDHAMTAFLEARGIPYLEQKENRGFPSDVNSMYDRAFTHGDFDNLIVIGNDVVVLPGAIDSMIALADGSDFEMVSGSEFNAQFLVNQYPEARQFFKGDDLIFTDFSARPWELHKDFRDGVEPGCRKDIRNFTLFKRSAFQKAGYDDVNYWPNGYYADNHYGRVCDIAGVSVAGLQSAPFFHFTSRTLKQNVSRDHGSYFSRNGGHYVHTWGGPVGGERYALPYNGEGFQLAPHIFLKGDLKISTRDQEDAIIEYWRNL